MYVKNGENYKKYIKKFCEKHRLFSVKKLYYELGYRKHILEELYEKEEPLATGRLSVAQE